MPASGKKATARKQKRAPHQGLVQVYTGNGKGKCVAADTWILTGSGFSTAESIVRRLGRPDTGKFTPISLDLATSDGVSCSQALYNGGRMETRTIRTRFGYELEGTLNHPVLTLIDRGLVWQRLKELSPGTYVAITREHCLFGSVQRPLNDAYLAGLLLGDGHIVAKKRYWRMSLSSNEPYCIHIWQAYLARYGLQTKTYPDRPYDHWVYSKTAVQRIIQDLWLAPKKADAKEIDPRWLECDRDTIQALLQGLFDSDGSVFGRELTVEFSTASSQLARQVHLLLLNFGIVAKCYSRKTPKLINHRLLIRGREARKFFERIGFRLPRKQEGKKRLARKHGVNVDIVPYTWELLKALPLSSELARRTSIKGPTPRLSCQLQRRTRSYREKGVNAGYDTLRDLLNHRAVIPSPEKTALLELCDLHYFWDQVVSLESHRAQVYDFCVPESQSFVGNGFVCHNTSAALGVGLRAVGHGFRVYMIQFMKGQINYGELEAVKYLPHFTIRQFGRPEFVDRRNPDLKDIALAKAALQHARDVMARGKVDFLILDEVNCAIDWGLVTEEEVVDLIRNRPRQMELILTGRYARPAIIELADLVSEIKEVKHPFQKGIGPRLGCEM